jgi:hypothetical protein
MSSNDSSKVDITSNINLFQSQHKPNNMITKSLYKMLYPKECLLRDLIFNMCNGHFNVRSEIRNINDIWDIYIKVYTMDLDYKYIELYPNVYIYESKDEYFRNNTSEIEYMLWINGSCFDFIFDAETNLSKHVKCNTFCSNKNPIDNRLIGEINKIMDITF